MNQTQLELERGIGAAVAASFVLQSLQPAVPVLVHKKGLTDDEHLAQDNENRHRYPDQCELKLLALEGFLGV